MIYTGQELRLSAALCQKQASLDVLLLM